MRARTPGSKLLGWPKLFGWLLIGLTMGAAAASGAEPRSLLLATTTSVQDSGLLDEILPTFTEESGIRVKVVAVGTGAALRMGREGNADVLLTHAPPAEQALVDDGVVAQRIELMQNYFVLAGPADDPARVREAPDVLQALRAIKAAKAPFVSRADDSGTHKKEKALLGQAGLDPEARWENVTRTGSGMGLSLQVAGQKSAYILSDVGTFLAFRDRIGLVALSKPEPSLRNVYSLLLLDPTRFPRIHSAEAEALATYLREPDTRRAIAVFGTKRFGEPLFTPIQPKAP